MNNEKMSKECFANHYFQCNTLAYNGETLSGQRLADWEFDCELFWNEYIKDEPWKTIDSFDTYYLNGPDFENKSRKEDAVAFAGTILDGIVSYRLSFGNQPPDIEAYSEILTLKGPKDAIKKVVDMIRICKNTDEFYDAADCELEELKKKMMEIFRWQKSRKNGDKRQL